MSEAQQAATPPTVPPTPSQGRRNTRKNKKKKTQQKENGEKFKGTTPDFGAVFSLADEPVEGNTSSFKQVLLATEVYVAAHFTKSAKAMSSLFEDAPTCPSLAPPIEPVGEDAESELQRVKYMELFKRYLNEKDLLSNHLHSLFTILWGQCSPGIQSKIRSSVDYLIRKEEGDCAWLLEEIRQVMYDFTSGRYRLTTLLEAKIDLLRYQQGRMSTIQYFNKYLEKIHAYERCGGSIGQEDGILKFIDEYDISVINAKPGKKPILPSTPTNIDFSNTDSLSKEQLVREFGIVEDYFEEMKQYQSDMRRWERKRENHDDLRKQVARDTYIGYLLLHNASDSKFGELKYDIHQDFLTGTNTFPDTAEGALKLLSNFQPRKTRQQQVRHQRGNEDVSVSVSSTGGESNAAVSFYQAEAEVAGIDGKSYPSVECWNCGSKGHYRNQCPATEAQHMQTVLEQPPSTTTEGDDGNYGLSYFQDTDSVPRKESHRSHRKASYFRILLDSGSTINTFKDRELLSSITAVNDPLVVLTNGGVTEYVEKGSFGSLRDVWFRASGLENIVSLALLKQVATVSFDSSQDSAFLATLSTGRVWRFRQTENGLFIYEHVHTTKPTNENVLDYCLISTVEANEK